MNWRFLIIFVGVTGTNDEEVAMYWAKNFAADVVDTHKGVVINVGDDDTVTTTTVQEETTKS